MEFLHLAMWHNCGSGMTCHWIRPNVRYIGIPTSGFDFDHITPHSNKLRTASMPPSAATTVPLAVASGGPPTGVAEAPPRDRWRRPGGGKPVTGQHPVYATGPALILVYRFFFTILLSQYCGILLRPFKRVTLRLSNRNLNQYSHCWHWPSPV